MSGSSNLLELDSWLQDATTGIEGMRALEIDRYSMTQPQTEALTCLYEAITILRNIVVDHIAASAEQR